MTTAVIALLVSAGVALVVWTAGDRQGTAPPDRPSREPTYTTSPNGNNDTAVADGRRLYRRYCVSCHGRQGRGEGPASAQLSTAPLNFHSDTAANFSDEQLFNRISHGKQSTGMPAWSGRLSQDQRWAIVNYLKRAFVEDRFDSPALR